MREGFAKQDKFNEKMEQINNVPGKRITYDYDKSNIQKIVMKDIHHYFTYLSECDSKCLDNLELSDCISKSCTNLKKIVDTTNDMKWNENSKQERLNLLYSVAISDPNQTINEINQLSTSIDAFIKNIPSKFFIIYEYDIPTLNLDHVNLSKHERNIIERIKNQNQYKHYEAVLQDGNINPGIKDLFKEESGILNIWYCVADKQTSSVTKVVHIRIVDENDIPEMGRHGDTKKSSSSDSCDNFDFLSSIENYLQINKDDDIDTTMNKFNEVCPKGGKVLFDTSLFCNCSSEMRFAIPDTTSEPTTQEIKPPSEPTAPKPSKRRRPTQPVQNEKCWRATCKNPEYTSPKYLKETSKTNCNNTKSGREQIFRVWSPEKPPALTSECESSSPSVSPPPPTTTEKVCWKWSFNNDKWVRLNKNAYGRYDNFHDDQTCRVTLDVNGYITPGIGTTVYQLLSQRQTPNNRIFRKGFTDVNGKPIEWYQEPID